MYPIPLFPVDEKPPPLKIVPSQAHPLLDQHCGYPYRSGVLHARSGNEQYPFLPSNILKSTNQRPLGNGDIYPSHIRSRQYHPGHGKVLKTRQSEAEYELLARSVYAEFLRCAGYQNYRSRQPKSGKKKKEQVWPDAVEFAFFRGMTHFEGA